MSNTITIVLFLMTLSALGGAAFSIIKLTEIKKGLYELGMRVLESQDIGKIKEAANKAQSLITRMDECVNKADENQNQIAEYKTKRNELADKTGASEQKIISFDACFNDLSTKLESVEQMGKKNEDGLAQTVPNIKALADEIQNLKMFQSATEKVRNLILDAFTTVQTSIPAEEVLGAMHRATKPDETTPEEARSEEAMPEEATSEVVRFEEATPEEATSEEARPEEARPEEATSEEARPEETTSEEATSEEVWSEEAKSDDVRPEEALQESNEWKDPNRVVGSRRWQS